MEALFQAIDLAGAATQIAAVGLVVVGIAMGIKGISVVKRVISKV